jgi:hypothetical protein
MFKVACYFFIHSIVIAQLHVYKAKLLIRESVYCVKLLIIKPT